MKKHSFKAVAMGASAGALDAITTILSQLPKTFPLPIIIVVHLPADKESIMAQLLAARTELKVCEAEDKQELEAGWVYIAPPDYHLLVEVDHVLSLSNEEPVLYSRPSIDVMFESAADAYGDALIGIVLTGGNSDGAIGLQTIMKEGGVGLVQNPKEAFTAAMPQAALAACPKAKSLKLNDIAKYLKKIT